MKDRAWFLFLLLVFIHLLLYTLVVSEGWLQRMLVSERRATQELLGPTNAQYAEDRAKHLFTDAFVDTGIQAQSFRTFVPTEQQQANDGAMSEVSSPRIFDWVESRLRAFWTMLYGVTQRVSSGLLWWPFILITLVPFLVDAFVTRKIKKTSFALTSPHMQGLATRAIPLLLIGYFLLLFVPVTVSPLVVPVLMVATSALMWVVVAHFVKRG
jgi:hypothetical protein